MQRESVLLHVCCGPCCIYPLQQLRAEGYAVTLLFANPNIHPFTEYLRRRESLQVYAAQQQAPVLWRDDVWDIHKWLRDVAVSGSSEPERCLYCYSSRLAIAADMAAAQGFDYVSASLLYSKYQRHVDILRLGEQEATRAGVRFLYRDFREGWQQGIDVSKEIGLYRQTYCGCIYSEAQRYEKKLKKLCQTT